MLAEGTFGLELVADLPSWKEYSRRVSLRGSAAPTASPITLIESVRQDRGARADAVRAGVRRGPRASRPAPQVHPVVSHADRAADGARLEKAGFEVTALLGDYQGGPWDPRAEAWIILARRR